ncbi:unnamed protein product [Darwinula stevensoni]|uniref:Uncharacterized protein n=1 Tax=Darwinula stevensoni TaxID=69355 RepID=A0A7R8XDB1_9CRUS|nr:unnamed protein product [Darwinula stevensoni]CAG0893329.1 unnamed protein product [Darwinula stevensoni]
MMLTLAFSLFPLLSMVFGATEQACPTQEILPCVCSVNEDGNVTVDCSKARTSEEVSSALNNATWPSTQLWTFRMVAEGPILDGNFPSGIFRNLTFQSMDIRLCPRGLYFYHLDACVRASSKKKMNTLAFFPLKSSLTSLTIFPGILEDFPSSFLHAFNRLEYLWLAGNSFTNVPSLKIRSLEILKLSFNKIARVEEEGWETPNLKELDLSFNSLTSIPALKIQSLEILKIPFNEITQVEKEGWKTPNLKELDLSFNSLTSVPALKMHSLEILTLWGNKIIRVEREGWETPNLKELGLISNSLTSIPALKIPSLEILTLEGNKIIRVEVEGWETPNLKKLDLSHNLLTSVPALKIHGLEILKLSFNKITRVKKEGWETPNLKELDLSHNSLIFLPALKMHSLEILTLEGSKMTRVEEEGWETPNLKELDIGSNRFSKFPSAWIKGLQKLEDFYCRNCSLGPILAKGFLEFRSTSLRKMDLRENNITKLEPGAITDLRPKTILDLSGNNITVFAEESFGPIMDVLSLGHGHIILGPNDPDGPGNPIQCDCEAAWFVASQEFLSRVFVLSDEGLMDFIGGRAHGFQLF